MLRSTLTSYLFMSACLLGAMTANGTAQAESLNWVIPETSPCDKAVADYLAKTGSNQATAIAVRPLQNAMQTLNAGTMSITFEIAPSIPGGMRNNSFKALPKVIGEIDVLKEIAEVAQEYGSWIAIVPYDSGEGAFDPETADYRIQLFVEGGNDTQRICLPVYPEEKGPVIIKHEAIPSLLGW